MDGGGAGREGNMVRRALVMKVVVSAMLLGVTGRMVKGGIRGSDESARGT